MGSGGSRPTEAAPAKASTEGLDEFEQLCEEDEGFRQALYNSEWMEPEEDYPPAQPASASAVPQVTTPIDDQRVKLMQQVALDAERSLTQLAKADVTPDPQAAAEHNK